MQSSIPPLPALPEPEAPQNSKGQPRYSKKYFGLSVVAAAIVVVLASVVATYAGTTVVLSKALAVPGATADFVAEGGTWHAKNNGYTVSAADPLQNPGDGNAATSIYKASYTANEWRVEVDAAALASSQSRDLSVIFDYIDRNNYWFANFSDSKSQFSNGIFKVVEGRQVALETFATTITPDKKYTIELRKKGDTVKAYQDRTYLAKAVTAQRPTTRFGFGTRGGDAVFYRIQFEVDKASAATTKPVVVAPPAPAPTPTPKPSNPSPTPQPTPSAPVTIPVPGGRIVAVSTAAQLKAALADARPGDDIRLADGLYKGDATSNFIANKPGTKASPIKLSGSKNAVIEGKSQGSGYALHLNGANYWVLDGFTVRFAQKGVMLDYSSNVIINKLTVTDIGNEAIHLRSNSSDNIVSNSIISNTGLVGNEQYGEGLYIGSAHSNWGKKFGAVTIPNPDNSNRNQILNNTISNTTGESIDIKEQTSGGIVRGNTFQGSGMSGAYSDSWIDVKGNNYLIDSNTGTIVNGTKTGTADGFQTHVEQPGWGRNNTFTKNIVDLQGPGYGFNLHTKEDAHTANIVKCGNVVKNAAKGFANVTCRP